MTTTSCQRASIALLLVLSVVVPARAGQAQRTAPEIVRDLFSLELVGATEYNPEHPHPVRARVVNPWDGFGYVGVEVRFELWDWSDDASEESSHLTSCMTDSSGGCEVDLILPWLPDGAEVEATVAHLGQERTTGLDVYPSAHAKFVLSTDRSIYRPGDEIHIRVLGLWPTASSHQDRFVELSGRDEQNQELFRESLELSSFGVATTSWTLPEERPPGEVRLSALAEGVARYRLLEVSTEPPPRFSLSLDFDKNYYLLDETAVLSLVAESFSGVSLAGASVSVFSPLDGSEELVAQSTLDAQGSGQVSLSLGQFLSSDEVLADWYYDDVRLRVVVDDPNSAASESRPAVLRVSRDEVHTYLIASGEVDEQGRALAWVTCFEADGSPRSCEVEIRSVDRSNGNDQASLSRGPVVGRASTGPFGVGTVEWTDFASLNQRGDVALVARDGSVRLGESLSWVSRSPEKVLAVRSPVLRSQGEPLSVEVVPLATARPRVRLEVWKYTDERYQRLEVRELGRLTELKRVDFSADPSWTGLLSFVAFDLDQAQAVAWHRSADIVAGLAHVLVLGSRQDQGEKLSVELSADAAEYQPRETARIRVSSDLRGDDAVVGLVAVDAEMRELERIRFRHGRDTDSFLHDVVYGERSGVAVGSWTLERLLGLSSELLASDDRVEVEPVAGLLMSRTFLLGFHRASVSPVQEIAKSGRGHFDRRDARRLEKAFATLSPREVSFGRGNELVARLSSRMAADERGGSVDDLVADEWGSPYRLEASLWPEVPSRWSATECRLAVESAGLDLTWSTVDDHQAGLIRHDCYRNFNQLLQRWLDGLVSSGRELPRDGQLLSADFLDQRGAFLGDLALTAMGFEVRSDRVIDPWSNPLFLRWGGWGSRRHLKVTAAGEDLSGAGFSSAAAAYRLPESLLREIEAGLRTAVDEQRWPRNDEQLQVTFSAVLDAMGLEAIYDPWGQPVFPRFDRLELENSAAPRAVEFRSSGSDQLEGTEDDFQLARLGCLGRGSSPWAKRIPRAGRGTVEGVVVDHQNFALPGATVEICGLHGTAVAVADHEGRFSFSRWPAGPVTLVSQLDGFAKTATSVEVEPDAQRLVTLRMWPATEETITVTSEAPLVDTQSVSAGTAVQRSGPAQTAIATPPVRRDFRDTLIFVPEQRLEDGETEVVVPLADDVTSWSVSAIVSTRDGRLGTATTDIPVRLPLWLEPRWPSRVTAGDKLSLPIQINNRSGDTRSVEWTADPAGLDLAGRRHGVASDVVASETIHVDTRYPRSGKARLKIGVRSSDGSLADSIEQELRVDPDGFQSVETFSALVEGTVFAELKTPEQVLDEPTTIEVKVYADLMDHVVDAVRGLVRRPAGCMEQVLSIAQGSLLALELLGENGIAEQPRLYAEARRNVELALRQLSRSEGVGSDELSPGGIAYWSQGVGDVALSAYALDFLQRASVHVDGYEGERSRLLRWLADHLERLEADAETKASPRWPRPRSMRQRVFLVWSIASYLESTETVEGGEDQAFRARLRESALAFLQRNELDEERKRPYLVALWGLAALALGQDEDAHRAGELLAIWAEQDQESPALRASWPLAGTSPFWGRNASGRVEATGLAVQLLSRLEGHRDLARSGTSWLVEHKLNDGAWSTTQSTVQALRALALTIDDEDSELASDRDEGDRIVLSVAGRSVSMPDRRPTQGGPRRLAFDVPTQSGEPLPVRVTTKNPAFVQVSAWTWVPWSSVEARASGEALAFDVDCGRGQRVGDPVDCRVEITRRGTGGMLVAEIGLPPGVQVDRDDLRSSRGWARQWSIDEERVLAYVYPDRGRATLEIRFRPLMPFDGLSTKSRLWDYYDPDRRVVLPPKSFRVKRR